MAPTNYMADANNNSTPEQDDGELREGFQLNSKWRFDTCIGGGAYGIVWSAHNTKLTPSVHSSPTQPRPSSRPNSRPGSRPGSLVIASNSPTSSRSNRGSVILRGSHLLRQQANNASSSSLNINAGVPTSPPTPPMKRSNNISQAFRRVAVKVIDMQALRSDSEKQSVLREVAVHKRLSENNHQNICQVLEVIETKTRVYIVMELVEGGSLLDYLFFAEDGLPEPHCALLFWQMLSAVEHCHNNLVLHRDIKLDNFLVSKSGNEVKLTDFGLCTNLVPGQLLNTGCGSPQYVAPEVLYADRQGYDGVKADIWALGITLYSILLNRMPFVDSRGRLIVSEALAGLQPKHIPFTLSSGAAEVLRMLLNPDAGKRSSIAELKKHPWVQKGRLLNEKRLEAKHQAMMQRRGHQCSLAERLSMFSSSSGRISVDPNILLKGMEDDSQPRKIEPAVARMKRPQRPASLNGSSGALMESMDQLFAFGMSIKAKHLQAPTTIQ